VQAGQLIGLDLGQSKTGLARASSVARLAEPVKTIPTTEVIDELKHMAEGGELNAIIVGLPRNLNGEDTDQTRWVRDWVERAKAELPQTHFYWQDEALTSQLASKRDAKGQSEDALAASIILQDFLDASEKDKA